MPTHSCVRSSTTGHTSAQAKQHVRRCRPCPPHAALHPLPSAGFRPTHPEAPCSHLSLRPPGSTGAPHQVLALHDTCVRQAPWATAQSPLISPPRHISPPCCRCKPWGRPYKSRGTRLLGLMGPCPCTLRAAPRTLPSAQGRSCSAPHCTLYAVPPAPSRPSPARALAHHGGQADNPSPHVHHTAPPQARQRPHGGAATGPQLRLSSISRPALLTSSQWRRCTLGTVAVPGACVPAALLPGAACRPRPTDHHLRAVARVPCTQHGTKQAHSATP